MRSDPQRSVDAVPAEGPLPNVELTPLSPEGRDDIGLSTTSPLSAKIASSQSPNCSRCRRTSSLATRFSLGGFVTGTRVASAFVTAMKAVVAAALVSVTTVVACPAPALALPLGGVETAANQACPSGILVRRDAGALSEADWTRFTSAVRTLQRGPAVTAYDGLVQRYLLNADQVLTNPWYLAWHRYYLRQFEIRLQAIDPGVTIPYWNFGYDSQAPELSRIWNYMGHNGVGPERAVSDGPFASWTPAYKEPHRLSRNWDQGGRMSGLPSEEVLNSIVHRSSSYNQFRKDLEKSFGAVHTNIGGDMAGIQSPNDPVFLLVYSNLDRLWAQWQQLSPANVTAYGGTYRDGTVARSTDRLPGFMATVRDTFNTSSFCYRYDS